MNATIPGSNIYSADRSGLPTNNFTVQGMLGAIAALVAAIGPAPNIPSSTTLSRVQSSPTTSTGRTSAPSESPVLPASRVDHDIPDPRQLSRGAIAGISLGGIAAIGLVLGCLALRLIRQSRKASHPLPLTSEPFAPETGVQESRLVFSQSDPTALIVGGPESSGEPCLPKNRVCQ